MRVVARGGIGAPPVPRLFANTPYGTNLWSRFLFEHYACLRPLHRVGAWLSDQGLPASPGTLAGSVPGFVPLFEPVAAAILAHQNSASLRHADETSWRVQALRETGRLSRAWLWTSAANDAVYFHIDPSRSAEATHKLFAEARLSTVIVCDRYSAYKRLARLLEGRVTLSFCWTPYAQGLHRVRGQPAPADRLGPGMDPADRVDLPPEQGAAGSLRPRCRAMVASVRRGPGRADRGARQRVARLMFRRSSISRDLPNKMTSPQLSRSAAGPFGIIPGPW